MGRSATEKKTASGGPGSSHYQVLTITLRHITLRHITLRHITLRHITLRHITLSWTHLNEGSACHRGHQLTTNKSPRQTSMQPAEFELIIPGNKRPQTHALHHAAKGISEMEKLRVDKDTVFRRISNEYLFVWKTQGGGE